MTIEHTDECVTARAGHSIETRDGWGKVIDLRDDPYPLMLDLTEEGRAAVLGCPHRDHDVVRLFCQVVL